MAVFAAARNLKRIALHAARRTASWSVQFFGLVHHPAVLKEQNWLHSKQIVFLSLYGIQPWSTWPSGPKDSFYTMDTKRVQTRICAYQTHVRMQKRVQCPPNLTEPPVQKSANYPRSSRLPGKELLAGGFR